MTLYTIMPQELIFQMDASEFERQKQVMYDGIPLIVELTKDPAYRVIRVLSSDPDHYLDSRFTPGSIIPIQ